MRGLAFVLFVAACRDDVAPPTDGGGDGDAGGGPGPVIPWLMEDGTAALAPAPPLLTPCPDGWREVMTDGLATCDPWPAGAPASCEAGEAHFPGTPGCAPIGATCPAGDFPDDLPASGVIHVRPGATAGDGSRAAPFGRIGEAMSVATRGSIIALARGRYDEVVSFREEVTLRGACPAETTITASGPDPRPAVVNVQVGGAALQDLRIADAGREALAIEGAGATASLRSVLIERTAPIGIGMNAGAAAAATRLVIRDIGGPAGGPGGRGVEVTSGATLTIDVGLIEGCREIGVGVTRAGSRVDLRDTAIRTTQGSPTGILGRGASVQREATLTLSRVVMEENADTALLATTAATVEIDHVLIRGVPAGPADVGFALFISGGAAVTGGRLAVERAATGAIAVNEPGSTARLSDVVVRDTLARPSDRLYGRAVNVFEGATVELTRLLVERSRDAGIAVNGAGSRVALADTVVRDTLGQDGSGTLGHGLEVVLGATLQATAVLVERTAEVGVLVSDGATLRAMDLVVRDGTGRPLDDAGGGALYVQRSSTAELDRVVLEGNRAIGAAALSASSVVARDALLRTTREVCVTTGECGNGIGAGAYGDGNVTLTRFRIADNALIGLQLARGGTADLHQGEVTGNPIGVNIQTEGFELGRLEDGVVYRMNGRDLDSEALPIPDLELPP